MNTNALKEQGLTQEQIDFVMAENGKDLKKLQTANDNLTTEKEALQTQLNDAQNTLKGFEGVDLKTIQADLQAWKEKAENAEKDYNSKIAERDFNDALKAEIDNIKFSSEAAKSAVVEQIKGAGLTLNNGKILGLNDLIEQIKSKDANAFVNEAQENLEQNKAKFTSSMSGSSLGKAMTKADIMKIKDASERQAAIAEHMDLFTN